MKPFLVVIACIMLLIWIIYQHRDRLNNAPAQAASHPKIIKDTYEFLPEARLYELVY
jgi:hypothetical protein